jgi:hypothetical protein
MKDFTSKTRAAPENHPNTYGPLRSSTYHRALRYLNSLLVDHTPDGPLIWLQQLQGYKPPPAAKSAFSWELPSKDTLTAVREGINADWLAKLVALWSQEGDRSNASTDMRMDNIFLIKQIGPFSTIARSVSLNVLTLCLAKIFEGAHLQSIFSVVDEVLFDVRSQHNSRTSD